MSAALHFDRIVAEQLTKAAAELRDESRSLDDRIHATRKRMKQVRAWIRLFRGALGDEFAIENRWCGDAGRELAPYRDATATATAIENFPPKLRADLGRRAVRHLRRLAKQRHDVIYSDGDETRGRMENVAAQLPIAAARLINSTAGRIDGFASIREGLSRTARDTRKAMKEAYRSGQAAAFHEWRKRVKDDWHQTQLLSLACPTELADRQKALDRLSHILGDHHDLEVVRDLVLEESETFDPAEAKRIRKILRDRQGELAARAGGIGKRLYKERPLRFVHRIEKRFERFVSASAAATVSADPR